jgi:hypothetical protein
MNTDEIPNQSSSLGKSPFPKLLYTKEDAAKLLNISVSSINWQLRKGPEVFPHHKIAGKIRFTQEDLQRIVKNSKVIKI